MNVLTAKELMILELRILHIKEERRTANSNTAFELRNELEEILSVIMFLEAYHASN
jgi:hypothetical protein